jgi:hypothetical protein
MRAGGSDQRPNNRDSSARTRAARAPASRLAPASLSAESTIWAMREVISPRGESIAGVTYTVSVRVGILSAAVSDTWADLPPATAVGPKSAASFTSVRAESDGLPWWRSNKASSLRNISSYSASGDLFARVFVMIVRIWV